MAKWLTHGNDMVVRDKTLGIKWVCKLEKRQIDKQK